MKYKCKTCGAVFTWSPSRAKQTNPQYCKPACRDADPARRTQLLAMNEQQQQRNPTRIEVIGYALLDSLDVEYLRQHTIGGKFTVDAFVPDASMVVQFDGDYWHGHPSKRKPGDARQEKRMRLDKSQDAYCRRCGYGVLRVWERDIHSRPDWVLSRMESAIERRTRASEELPG